MAQTDFTGGLALNGEVNSQLQALPGGSLGLNFNTVAGIPNGVPTRIARLTIPNAAMSAGVLLVLRVGVTAAGHSYDSTQMSLWYLAVTDRPGVLAAASLTSTSNASATVGGGTTIGASLALGPVGGPPTGPNTFDLLVTNTCTPAGLSDATISWHFLDAVTPSGAGIVISA